MTEFLFRQEMAALVALKTRLVSQAFYGFASSMRNKRVEQVLRSAVVYQPRSWCE